MVKPLSYIAVALVAIIITRACTYTPLDKSADELLRLANRQNALILQQRGELLRLAGLNAALADSLSRVKAEYAKRPYIAQRRQLDSLSAPLDSIRLLAERFAR